MKLVTPEQMRQMDRQAIDEVGIPGIVLMERAALGAVQTLYEYLPSGALGPIGFLCGGGNNGGDGLAMARMVANDGYQPVVVLMSAADSYKGDAATNLAILRKLNVPLVELGDCEPDEARERLDEFGYCLAWCDALLGTGLDREVKGRYAAAIDFINAQPFAFAVDIPSGVNGTSGQVMGCAVDADVTATFGEVKLGQAVYPGRALCGDLHVIDIGIPPAVVDEVGWQAELIDARWTATRMGGRPASYHKGDSGKLLIVAGSHEKTGAALLACRGALASGVGLLTVGTHAQVIPRIATTVNEAMAAPMLSDVPDGGCRERLMDFLDQVDAIGMGPGIGTNDGTNDALEAVLNSQVPAAVFDADALTLLSQLDDYAPLRAFAQRADVVLTPHPGEMARLSRCTIADITADTVGKSVDLANETGCIVVCKTAATVMAAPASDDQPARVCVNSTGNPGMSTGGVGDVLTGIVAARLAEASEDAFDAVCLAVYAHGAAGDAAADELGERGMAAVDLAKHLPGVWKQFEE